MATAKSIQSMALAIAKVADEVSNVLGTPVSVDQVVEISRILGGQTSTSSVAVKVAKKQKKAPVKAKRLDWSKFNFEKYADGEVHIVPTSEIRSLLGIGTRLPNGQVLRKFISRLSLWALTEHNFSVRTHMSKDHTNVTVQAYLK